MANNQDNYDDIKRKIRELKKLEIKIRFSNTSYADIRQSYSTNTGAADLVWNEFFDLHEASTGKAKYSIIKLAMMNKDEFKNVVNEFFFHIYYKFYKENGIVNTNFYEPGILARMGLPIDADVNEIKKKFRELAKKYHPDTGGDSTKFIELMENYRRLIN